MLPAALGVIFPRALARTGLLVPLLVNFITRSPGSPAIWVTLTPSGLGLCVSPQPSPPSPSYSA